ncbi:hypothetical protein PROFUN_06616 [Planoprotostelium fungivorum]|uniref:Uncharacterized protein n=1 Tax=Planoprotostelium fungivorum TaxID=1890364 RepID=A0A2P6MSS6_9EUKA|nr:hypothetical protein PROFUN_06616 [Planoprotostelium fungivorum]
MCVLSLAGVASLEKLVRVLAIKGKMQSLSRIVPQLWLPSCLLWRCLAHMGRLEPDTPRTALEVGSAVYPQLEPRALNRIYGSTETASENFFQSLMECEGLFRGP